MKPRNFIFLALGLFALPILLRFFAFYQLPYFSADVQRPDYASYKIPEPPTPSVQQAAVAQVEAGKVIIIDAYHGNQFSPSEIEPLVTALSARGGRVEFDKGVQSLAAQLKYASAYVILSPSIAFSADELRAIRQFVGSGGRLLVFADPTRSLITYDLISGAPLFLPDVNYANPVLAPFGLNFVNDYLYNLQDNEGNFRNVKFTDFADNSITAGLNMVVFYGVHSVQTNTGTALVTAEQSTLSSVTDRGGSISPLALSADGQVLAAGDFSFLIDPFTQVADNAVLLGSIADFALGGKRIPSLENFPYVFQNPVSLVTTGDVRLNADLLAPLAGLQGVLKLVNVPLNVREEAPEAGDVIVLGTLAPSDDLAPYVNSFGIDLEAVAEDSLEIKGFGTVNPSESGLLLLSSGPKSNVFVLLAPSQEKLPDLVRLVASGDLSACVVQANMGICSLAGGDSTSSYDDTETETPFPSETPVDATPLPSPTASG